MVPPLTPLMWIVYESLCSLLVFDAARNWAKLPVFDALHVQVFLNAGKKVSVGELCPTGCAMSSGPWLSEIIAGVT